MVNIFDINPECFMVSNVKECTDGTVIYNLCYSDKIGVPHIVFNNIEYYFDNSEEFNYLYFCVNDKSQRMIGNYKIIEQQ